MTETILALMLPFAFAASAACSAIETALFSVTHTDRVRLRKSAPRAAAAVATLLARPRELLITILLANITANTVVYVVSSELARTHSTGVASAIVGVLATLSVILLSEILPKTVAAKHRVGVSRVLARPLLIFAAAIGPIRMIGDRLVLAPLARLVSASGGGEREPVSVEELRALVVLGAREGTLDLEEQSLLAEVLQLGSLRVRDVMTPRVDICVIDENASLEDLLQLIRRTGHSKFPACRGVLDGGVSGFVSAKRLLAARHRVGAGILKVGQIVEPVRYVPDRARLDQLLEHFRRTSTHIAMCVNEIGEVTGMVEVEDVIKQMIDIPGAAQDGLEDEVRFIGLGEWEVPGRLGIRAWSGFFGARSEGLSLDSRISTVAGLILAKLGRVPRVGDAVELRNIRLRVESMRGRTVDRVRVVIGELSA